MVSTPTAEVMLRLRCYGLPGTTFGERKALRLGIQRGSIVIEDVPAVGGAEVVFAFPVVVRSRGGAPDFGGPFVQGRPGGRFIYLCWGERQGGDWDQIRRAKVPLAGLTQRLLDQAQREGRAIEVALEMTDARGAPICASIPEKQVAWRLGTG
jgi:hypothetical protein